MDIQLPILEQEIAALIPHAGSMCLLQRVQAVSELHIHCQSTSQQLASNPLRVADAMPVSAGIEYAAQAMAVHGRLLALAANAAEQKPKRGYIVVLSKVDFFVASLESFALLDIFVDQEMALATGSQYSFRLESSGHCLLSGQAVVSLDES